MNEERSPHSGNEHYRSLQILDELSNNDSLTQRDLSSHLGIALGLVNSYIKNLIAKGYITVKTIPRKRYAYYLTPKGFAEKSRLTYDLLQDYTRIYREARKNLKELFHELERNNVRRIILAGADEVAEIAYITLQETSLELAGVVDAQDNGKKFFGRTILPFSGLAQIPNDAVIITTYIKRNMVYQELIKEGVKRKEIHSIFSLADSSDKNSKREGE